MPVRKLVLLAWSNNPLSVYSSESGESGMLVDMHKPTCSPSWETGNLLRLQGPALEMHRFSVSCCILLQTSPTWAWWTGWITVWKKIWDKGTTLCWEFVPSCSTDLIEHWVLQNISRTETYFPLMTPNQHIFCFHAQWSLYCASLLVDKSNHVGVISGHKYCFPNDNSLPMI